MVHSFTGREASFFDPIGSQSGSNFDLGRLGMAEIGSGPESCLFGIMNDKESLFQG
jgi:hypothetical protein